jgi:hypothetical protein
VNRIAENATPFASKRRMNRRARLTDLKRIHL